jgi:hypothetical protein
VQRGDLLVRIGAVLFGIGTLAVVVVLVPFLSGDRHEPPLALNLMVLLLPLGLGLALLGLLVGARDRH